MFIFLENIRKSFLCSIKCNFETAKGVWEAIKNIEEMQNLIMDKENIENDVTKGDLERVWNILTEAEKSKSAWKADILKYTKEAAKEIVEDTISDLRISPDNMDKYIVLQNLAKKLDIELPTIKDLETESKIALRESSNWKKWITISFDKFRWIFIDSELEIYIRSNKTKDKDDEDIYLYKNRKYTNNLDKNTEEESTIDKTTVDSNLLKDNLEELKKEKQKIEKKAEQIKQALSKIKDILGLDYETIEKQELIGVLKKEVEKLKTEPEPEKTYLKVWEILQALKILNSFISVKEISEESWLNSLS